MRAKHLLMLSALAGFQFTTHAQYFEWGKYTQGSPTTNIFVTATRVSPSGDAVFSGGNFNGSVNFDPGASNFTINTAHSAFITKRDAEGLHEWTHAFASDLEATFQFNDLAVDADGNSYIVGNFSGTVDCDPGPAIHTLSTTAFEFFLIKLDSDGDFVWAQQFGSSTHDKTAIYIRNNAIYCAGVYSGTADFEFGPGVTELTAADLGDIFVMKMTTDGTFEWVVSMGSATNTNPSEATERIWDIAVGPSDEVVISGSFTQPGDFDPGAGTTTLTSAGSLDAFLLKLDSDGVFQWAVRSGNAREEMGLSIDIAPNGSIYQCGISLSAGSPYYYNAFITCYSAAGTELWGRQLDGSNSAMDTGVAAHSVTVDETGAAYIGGWFYSPNIDFDPGAGEQHLGSTSQDGYLLKLTSEGAFAWVLPFTNSNNNSFVELDHHDDMLYANGVFSGSVDLDPGSGESIVTGGSGMSNFLIKLQTSGIGLSVNTPESVPFQLWPNPATDAMQLQLEKTGSESSVVIFNLQGERVLEQQLKALVTEIDLQQLSSGTYLVEIRQDGLKSNRRLVKM